jgi:ATP-dependent exoDNAse (exonuclease V) beta subunit
VYPHLADTVLPLKTSVTGALDYSSDEPYVKTYFDEDFIKDHTDEKRGIIAHKVLELMDFFSPLSYKLQIENLVDNGLIDKEDILLINVDNILNALKNPIISTLKDMQVFKEKSFICYIPSQSVNGVISDSNVLVQGVIDLLAIKENEAIILDYKYSKKGKEALIKTYKKQLDLYALAVENSLNVKVVKKAILSLVSGEIVFID